MFNYFHIGVPRLGTWCTKNQVYKSAKKAENLFRYGLVVQKHAFENSKSWEMINHLVVRHEIFLAALTKTENHCLVYWALQEDEDYERFLKFIFSRNASQWKSRNKQSLPLLCYLDFWSKINLLYPLLHGIRCLPPCHSKPERSSSFPWFKYLWFYEEEQYH